MKRRRRRRLSTPAGQCRVPMLNFVDKVPDLEPKPVSLSCVGEQVVAKPRRLKFVDTNIDADECLAKKREIEDLLPEVSYTEF